MIVVIIVVIVIVIIIVVIGIVVVFVITVAMTRDAKQTHKTNKQMMIMNCMWQHECQKMFFETRRPEEM